MGLTKIQVAKESLNSTKLEIDRFNFKIVNETEENQKVILTLKSTKVGANWCVFNAMQDVKVIQTP
jgi:hypothetical protein